MSTARIGIVVSRFNATITDALLEGAIAELAEHQLQPAAIIRVAGAFEIPSACQHLADKVDGIITLGAVIKGETAHFEYVAKACVDGIMQVSLNKHIPITFGVLTTFTQEQALARIGGDKGHQGKEAAVALLDLLHQIATLT